jgi:hypothetical protein
MNSKKRAVLANLKKLVKQLDAAVDSIDKRELDLDSGKLMAIADELELFITDELRDEYGSERASQEYEDL